MNTILKLLLSLIILLLGNSIYAQDQGVYNSDSKYTYVCKIPVERAISIRTEYSYDNISSAMVSKVDSFLVNVDEYKKDHLPLGQYVFLSIINDRIEYSQFQITNIDVKNIHSKRNLNLYVFDKKSNEVISNARVTLVKKKLKYNQDLEVYQLSKNKNSGVVEVATSNDTALVYINNEYYGRLERFIGTVEYKYGQVVQFFSGDRNPYYRYGSSGKLNGYLVLNKPKYLPNDTLKWKAYLVKKNGRPYKKDVTYSLRENGYGSPLMQSEVINQEKGVYFDQFCMGDSLVLDTYYNLEIRSLKKDEVLYSKRFSYEEYQLNEVKYEVRVPEEKYRSEETIAIYLSGKDANGFPIVGGRAHVELKINRIYDYLGDTVFVPGKLLEKDLLLDPIGETKLIFPDSIFPNLNMEVEATITFNNSNFEQLTIFKKFEYEKQTEWISTKLEGDSIFATYYIKGKEQQAIGEVQNDALGNLSNSVEINYPYGAKLDSRVNYYSFKKGDVIENLSLELEKSKVSLRFRRTNDSIFMYLHNPRKLKVHYTVNRKNNVAFEGVAYQLDTAFKVTNSDMYKISHSYIWGGEGRQGFDYLQKFSNNLTVKIDQPKRVSPGQTVDLVVKVFGVDGKPVPKVNLTAYAINSQFNNDETVAVPYLGKYSKSRNFAAYYTLSSDEETGSNNVGKKDLSPFGVDSLAYFQLAFPKDGYYEHVDSTTGIENAQFSPFVFHNGRQEDIHLIYVDGYLVYFDLNSTNTPYAFEIEEGCHSIRIRTTEKEYQVLDFCIKEGQKIDLSLARDSISQNVIVQEMPNKPTQYELALLNRSMLYFMNDHKNDVYFIQGSQVYYERYGRYAGQTLVGPIQPGRVDIAVTNGFKMSFEFVPGFLYSIRDGVVKMQSSDRITSITRWPFSEDKRMGQIVKPITVVRKKMNYPQLGSELFYSGVKTIKENGELQLEYNGEQNFFVIQLQKVGTKEFTRLYRGYKRKFTNLKEGEYRMLLVNSNNEFMITDGLKIKKGGVSYYRLHDSEFKKADDYSEMESFGWELTEKDTNLLTFILNDSLGGVLSGVVIDSENNEPVPFANIIIENESGVLGGIMSDFEGEFVLAKIPPGKYTVKVNSMGFQPVLVSGVMLANNKISPIEIRMSSSSLEMKSFEVVTYSNKLIDKGYSSVKTTVSAEDFGNMAVRSATDVAKNMAGVYASDDGSGDLNIRGARADANYYYIDGMKVIGSSNLPKSAIGEIMEIENQESDISSDLENELLMSSSAGIRDNFDDSGFWIPNLYTDKNGEAKFQVTFPDNITKWKTRILAMDSKKRSGQGIASSVSFKPILAELSTPRFLVEGDSTLLVSKITSYVDSPQKFNTFFSVNGDTVYQKEEETSTALINHFPLMADDSVSMRLAFGLKNKQGYSDGEERIIPVIKQGIMETEGAFYVLRGDTAFTIPAFDGQVEIKAQGDRLHLLLNEIEKLEKYPYYCMEQTASKLVGLLNKQEIQEKLNEPFKDKRVVNKLLERLISNQNSDGGWGWWPGSSTSHWMSIYVLEALNLAEDKGYALDGLSNVGRYLVWELDRMNVTNKLYALKVISDENKAFPVKSYLGNMKLDSLNINQKIRLAQVHQNSNLKVNIVALKKMAKQTIYGNYYWKGEKFGWDNNTIMNTLLAYQVILHNDSLDEMLPKIRDYFIEQADLSTDLNTVSRAQIVNTLSPFFLSSEGEEAASNELAISEVDTSVTVFPYKLILDSCQRPIRIQHQGSGTVYLSVQQSSWVKKTIRNDSLYEVNSWFELEGERMDSLPAGKMVDLKVKVNVKYKGNYVMIEVPIPGGCSYGVKSGSNRYETHRESFKEKVSIFCESLPEGEHVFTIPLQPRYSGLYYLNPVQVQMMYFPVLNGNNEIKMSVIE